MKRHIILFSGFLLMFLPLCSCASVYTIPVTVYNNMSHDVTGYQVEVRLGYSSHMQPDFDDVFFMKSDNSTQLSFWRKNYTLSQEAIFYVRLDIPVNYSTFYIYYGYPNERTKSNGYATFDFFESFDCIGNCGWILANENWDFGQDADYSIRFNNGSALLSGTAGCYTPHADGMTLSMLKELPLLNGSYVLELSARGTGGKYAQCAGGVSSENFAYIDGKAVYSSAPCAYTGCGECATDWTDAKSSVFTSNGSSKAFRLSTNISDCESAVSRFDNVRVRKSLSTEPLIIIGTEGEITGSGPATTTTTLPPGPVSLPVIGTGRGSSGGQLYEPTDIAVGLDGAAYVIERYNGRISKFDNTKTFVWTQGRKSESMSDTDLGVLDAPKSISLYYPSIYETRFYVADTMHDRVQILSAYNKESSFNWSYSYGERLGSSERRISRVYFENPAGIDVADSGIAVAADPFMNEITPVKFDHSSDLSGGLHYWIVGNSTVPGGAFVSPQSALLHSGRLYIADTGNNMIRIFDTYLGEDNAMHIRQNISFGGLGTGRGQFNAPTSIDVDDREYIYVADSGNDRVSIYDSLGRYVEEIGSRNCATKILTHPENYLGQFCTPMGVEVENRKLYVADTWNHRVQVFDVSYLPEPSCLTAGDTPPCGEIALLEVITHINKWAIGEAELSEVIVLINKWVQG
jgi:DNA-binding beta-propeller fold protein YncE